MLYWAQSELQLELVTFKLKGTYDDVLAELEGQDDITVELHQAGISLNLVGPGNYHQVDVQKVARKNRREDQQEGVLTF